MSKAKPIDRLMAAMDDCARARAEANWTNGYRASKQGDPTEESRLYEKEQQQWAACERVEKRFRRVAMRLLREVAQRPIPGEVGQS